MSFLKTFFAGGSSALDAADARARIKEDKKSLMILDVRQPDEFWAGHIAGATLIPLNELRGRIGELPKDKEILCVCRSGSRSGAAVRQLSSAGFDALNLRGGMMSWERAGYPVKKGQ